MRKITPAWLACWVIAGLLLFGQFDLSAVSWMRVMAPSGPRIGLLVRESFDDTAAQSRMFTDLRSGPAAKYLAEKGHTLTILDDDETDADNKPLSILAKNELAGKFNDGSRTPPWLLIISPPDKVLAKQSLPPEAKADDVLAAFKAHGG